MRGRTCCSTRRKWSLPSDWHWAVGSAGSPRSRLEGLRDRRERRDEDDRRDQGAPDHAHRGGVRRRSERPRAGALPLSVPGAGRRAHASLARGCVKPRSRWRLRSSSRPCCRRPRPRTSVELRRRPPTISPGSPRPAAGPGGANRGRRPGDLDARRAGSDRQSSPVFAGSRTCVSRRRASRSTRTPRPGSSNRVRPLVVPRGITPSDAAAVEEADLAPLVDVARGSSPHARPCRRIRPGTPISAAGSSRSSSTAAVRRSAAASGSRRPLRFSGSGRSSWSRRASRRLLKLREARLETQVGAALAGRGAACPRRSLGSAASSTDGRRSRPGSWCSWARPVSSPSLLPSSTAVPDWRVLGGMLIGIVAAYQGLALLSTLRDGWVLAAIPAWLERSATGLVARVGDRSRPRVDHPWGFPTVAPRSSSR